MIQVYKQGDARQPLREDLWMIGTYSNNGLSYGISYAETDGIYFQINGENQGSDIYLPLTQSMQDIPEGYYLRIDTRDFKAGTRNDIRIGLIYECPGTAFAVLVRNNIDTDHWDITSDTLPDDASNVRICISVNAGVDIASALTYYVNADIYRTPYETKEDYLSHNGDMTLFPTEATVHAALNGTWEAALEHPIDEEGRWKYLEEEAVIKMPSFNGDQLFRIKKTKKSDSGISCTMEPIFYDSIGDCFLEDVRPTKKNGQQALDLMLAPNGKYSGSSDITRTATAYYQFKNFMEALNGEDENSFINRWGGEILFDNFKVIVNERVGGDYGVELRYGKNIKRDGLTEEVDTRDIVTRIYPKAYNGYTMKSTDEFSDGAPRYVDSPLVNSYPTIKTATITFDDVKMAEDAQEDDEDNGIIVCDTQEELNEALEKKCKEQFDAGLDKPKINISADMILLANTELYKDYKILETVSLGDNIHCRHSRLGIVTDARVIELEYDSIHKKVSSVVLGDFQYDYFDNVSSAVNRIDGAIRPDGSLMAEKIAGFINGAMASLRAQYNVAQKQDVLAILFENLDEDSPLYGAMAMGTQGLMISKTRTADGRGWDWTTALTANGLIAGIIVAGILSDQTGKNWWDLDRGVIHLESGYFSGEIHAGSGTFAGQLIAATGTFSGNLSAAGGTFSGLLSAEVGGYIGGFHIDIDGLTGPSIGIFSKGSIDTAPDLSDGTTQIYPDGISTARINAILEDPAGFTGEIRVVTDVTPTGNGGFTVSGTTIPVRKGIITKLYS